MVAGYSGRDDSIIELFRSVLETNNAFPHGLFWTEIKGVELRPPVTDLLALARAKGIEAHHVPIETFDALMLRIWRNLDDKPPGMDERVQKLKSASVLIPLPELGHRDPILRLNALPVLATPGQCLELSFNAPKNWDNIRKARIDSGNNLILTKGPEVLCWGAQGLARKVFADDLTSVQPHDLPKDITAPTNLYLKGFLEEALCGALARSKPVLARSARSSSFLIADPHAGDKSPLAPLVKVVGATAGTIQGLLSRPTEHRPQPEKVSWAEAARLSIDFKDGLCWLLLDPDIWIWPQHARVDAAAFLDERRGDRFNQKYNALLDAWIQIALGTAERNVEVTVSAFASGTGPENPSFRIASRTAFSRRLSA